MNLPIGRNALLQALPAIALGLLTPHLNPRPLVRGDVLIRAGERVSVVYFPVSGVVSLVVPTAGGIGVESAMIARFQDLLLAQTQQAAACNALHGVVARTCRWLLQVRQRSDEDMLPLTQEFMAQMLGVQRTTVTLVTRTLQDAGLIKQERGRLIVLDQNGLMNAACECYATMTRQLEEMLPAHEPGAL
jgi:CRP-like cAMP-binding protein